MGLCGQSVSIKEQANVALVLLTSPLGEQGENRDWQLPEIRMGNDVRIGADEIRLSVRRAPNFRSVHLFASVVHRRLR